MCGKGQQWGPRWCGLTPLCPLVVSGCSGCSALCTLSAAGADFWLFGAVPVPARVMPEGLLSGSQRHTGL